MAAGAKRLAITITAATVETILSIVCFFIIFSIPLSDLRFFGPSCAACKTNDGASNTTGDQPKS
jgi:hypothetical protein